MIKTDLHVHTTFCDGKNTPEEMVNRAISLNLTEIGLVCHAFTSFDNSYCIKSDDVNGFIQECGRLKVNYKDKISVKCGVEYDYFANMSVEGFDYIIGAVHYVYKDGKYIDVDESKKGLIDSVKNYYGGNFYAFCQDYYQTLSNVYAKVNPHFIAHFDLVSKFNKDGDLFEEKDARYISAWQQCADKLIENNAVFELNVGAISRGYKDTPYPSQEQINYIASKGGKFIINSDAHSINSIAFNFDKYVSLIGEENITKINIK